MVITVQIIHLFEICRANSDDNYTQRLLTLVYNCINGVCHVMYYPISNN
jgi:hypothetical protein